MHSQPGYLDELKAHLRPLAAATIGIAFGLSINNYTSSLFGAQLIHEFGWAKAEFAKIAVFAILLVPMFPVIGRLTDVLGVRFAAAIGVIGMPITFVGLANMSGNINTFFALTVAQILTGGFLTSTVFNRVVAERFTVARGIAFAIIMTGPPVSGGLAAWALGPLMVDYGWRGGYLFLGGLVLVFGILALILLPAKSPVRQHQPSTLRKDFGTIARHPVFWLASLGMFLCNLPQALGSSQLMLMLQENGVALSASFFVALYPFGVVIGRFATGAALDRYPTHIVGAIGLALPALGFVLLAGPYDGALLVGFSVLLMGLAQGAEGDVAAYAVARHFPISIFASAMGPVNAATALGASLGGAVLVPMLARWDNYVPFLIFSAVVTLLGGIALFLMGRYPMLPEEPVTLHD
ncbi:nitrate/nitrite transporter [Sphingomonas sp. SUN039]|uniref:MFS transporter n=1 Tax=Sphingomonas sp. SUN039 TaxID=2937787 RepID=UPI002164377B|nr:MFS transporter [Sphingomonas sp. SUN039]UVO54297.1 MFS transporter [Sphingomonas sp. SUN039]